MGPGDDQRDEIPLLIADLYEVSGAMRRQGDRLASAAGQTQSRWQVLSVISEGEWTAPRIAARLGVTRQAVQRVIDALAAEGLVSVEPNPAHERSSLIRPTAAGDEALSLISIGARRFHEQMASTIDPADLAGARRVLRALIDAEAADQPEG